MSVELLYTSAPQGLKSGSRGFCTVVSTIGMPLNLATRLEGLSAYRHIYPPQDSSAHLNPVGYSHLKVNVGGRSLSILSRCAAYGVDYSQRTNKIVHHVVLDPEERRQCGPAALLQVDGLLKKDWDGTCRTLAQGPILPNPVVKPEVCRTWEAVQGDAGWGGTVAESFANPSAKTLWIVFSVEQSQLLLSLLAEAIALLPPAPRWNATFSTYCTNLPPDVECRVRCVLAGTDEARLAPVRGSVLVLGDKRPLTAASDLITLARTGIPPAGHNLEPDSRSNGGQKICEVVSDTEGELEGSQVAPPKPDARPSLPTFDKPVKVMPPRPVPSSAYLDSRLGAGKPPQSARVNSNTIILGAAAAISLIAVTALLVAAGGSFQKLWTTAVSPIPQLKDPPTQQTESPAPTDLESSATDSASETSGENQPADNKSVAEEVELDKTEITVTFLDGTTSNELVQSKDGKGINAKEGQKITAEIKAKGFKCCNAILKRKGDNDQRLNSDNNTVFPIYVDKPGDYEVAIGIVVEIDGKEYAQNITQALRVEDEPPTITLNAIDNNQEIIYDMYGVLKIAGEWKQPHCDQSLKPRIIVQGLKRGKWEELESWRPTQGNRGVNPWNYEVRGEVIEGFKTLRMAIENDETQAPQVSTVVFALKRRAVDARLNLPMLSKGIVRLHVEIPFEATPEKVAFKKDLNSMDYQTPRILSAKPNDDEKNQPNKTLDIINMISLKEKLQFELICKPNSQPENQFPPLWKAEDNHRNLQKQILEFKKQTWANIQATPFAQFLYLPLEAIAHDLSIEELLKQANRDSLLESIKHVSNLCGRAINQYALNKEMRIPKVLPETMSHADDLAKAVDSFVGNLKADLKKIDKLDFEVKLGMKLLFPSQDSVRETVIDKLPLRVTVVDLEP